MKFYSFSSPLLLLPVYALFPDLTWTTDSEARTRVVFLQRWPPYFRRVSFDSRVFSQNTSSSDVLEESDLD
ncbi:hypothetical protein GGU10DRAFT_362758 [Lentinula aff. detonsa]|uniref:Secreted protein n=1 Tax=Lentinula aff. detonsa TaxID=2804958 RepID=A0AA38K8U0_9AGAR|nr:hypothetical protein GGU10DRAFT_362758 [Lentinula aff. detonsa]